MDLKERLAAEAQAAEEAELVADELEPLPPNVRVTRGHGRSKVLQVRLNEDEFSLVEKLAADASVPPSTLARAFLLDAMSGA